MKKLNILLGFGLLLFFVSCTRESAENVVKGYLSESSENMIGQLPEELKSFDSLLMDSISIREKIGEITNLDSLEKYNQLLMDAENLIKTDIPALDSISPDIKNMLDLNE